MVQSGFLLQFLLCYLVFALGNDQACVHMKENKKVDIDETCKTVPCLIKCCPESQILFDNGTELHCATTSYLEMTYNVSNLEDYSDLEIYNADIKREIIKTNKRINNFTILNYKNFSLCNSNEIFVMQPILVPHVLEVSFNIYIYIKGSVIKMGKIKASPVLRIGCRFLMVFSVIC